MLNSGNACYYALQRLLSSQLVSINIKLKIYKTVILPVILYGCETWTLSLREEKRLLRKIFGPKRDEETGEWRRLHNTHLKDLYGKLDIIRKIKSHRLRYGNRFSTTTTCNTRKLGLEVNINKTKYMVTHRNASCNAKGQLMMTNEGNFEEVAEFKYLGALITNRNEIQKEIKHRLNSGSACYYALQGLLSSKRLSRNIKLKIYKTVILPEKRLRVFENKVLRKIFGAERDEETGEFRRLHNTELMNLYGKSAIIRKIKSHRLRWAGYVARLGNERGVRRILEGKPEGKHTVGRLKMKWENNINRDLREVDYTGDDCETLAQNRDVWRAYVRTAMNLRLVIILYDCETWTLTLREEKRLRRDEETGELRRLHNTELKDLYGKLDIIRKIKSNILRWAGYVARLGNERGVMKWENNINRDLREVDYTGDDCKTLAKNRDVWP
ncbi:hypothetical protein C0J52_18431 [Blattella germanica]|nr:hypothetical protein C0J52_18431 [Blattella germanica]